MTTDEHKLHQADSDNPLDTLIAGTRHKAYLVAGLALKASPKQAADQFGIELASVHSAIAFYTSR